MLSAASGKRRTSSKQAVTEDRQLAHDSMVEKLRRAGSSDLPANPFVQSASRTSRPRIPVSVQMVSAGISEGSTSIPVSVRCRSESVAESSAGAVAPSSSVGAQKRVRGSSSLTRASPDPLVVSMPARRASDEVLAILGTSSGAVVTDNQGGSQGAAGGAARTPGGWRAAVVGARATAAFRADLEPGAVVVPALSRLPPTATPRASCANTPHACGTGAALGSVADASASNAAEPSTILVQVTTVAARRLAIDHETEELLSEVVVT